MPAGQTGRARSDQSSFGSGMAHVIPGPRPGGEVQVDQSVSRKRWLAEPDRESRPAMKQCAQQELLSLNSHGSFSSAHAELFYSWDREHCRSVDPRRWSGIAEQVGIGHSTVSNWLASGTFPERKPREQASHLDRYLPYLLERWEDGCHNIACHFRELVERGYKGSYESVRDNLVRLLPAGRKNAAKALSKTSALPTSRQAAFLFLRRASKTECRGAGAALQGPSDRPGSRLGL